MKAIVLAAGYATRLYPLTKEKPKALLEIGGEPILTRITRQILALGAVSDIFVISNHKFIDHFNAWAEKITFEANINVLDDGTDSEETRRGAIGDLDFCIDEKAIDDELLVIAGDNYFTFDLCDFYAFYRDKAADCVCAKQLFDVGLLRQMGVAEVDSNQRVIGLSEKPEQPRSDLAVYASYFYTRETVKLFKTYIREGNKPDAPGYFTQWLHSRKPLFAWLMDGDCYDIGTVESYNEAAERFRKS